MASATIIRMAATLVPHPEIDIVRKIAEMDPREHNSECHYCGELMITESDAFDRTKHSPTCLWLSAVVLAGNIGDRPWIFRGNL